MRRVDHPPAPLRRLDQLERHRQPGGLRPVALESQLVSPQQQRASSQNPQSGTVRNALGIRSRTDGRQPGNLRRQEIQESGTIFMFPGTIEPEFTRDDNQVYCPNVSFDRPESSKASLAGSLLRACFGRCARPKPNSQDESVGGGAEGFCKPADIPDRESFVDPGRPDAATASTGTTRRPCSPGTLYCTDRTGIRQSYVPSVLEPLRDCRVSRWLARCRGGILRSTGRLPWGVGPVASRGGS